jgi:phosphoglycolate phosphatase
MTDLIVFDKDGVILDLEATWLPVARAVAHYTASRIPDDWDGGIGGVELLAAIGVDEAAGEIDSRGIFAAGSFADIRSCWQKMLPSHMIKLDQDDRYKQDVQILVDRHGRNQTVPKGEVEAPLHQLHKDGYRLAVLTNDSESSAKRNMQDIGVLDLFCTVVGADSGFGSKPGPHGFLHCCQIAGVTPAASIMVGDTMADYGAAIAAKAGDFICVADSVDNRPHQDIHHENVIGRIDQLPALMERRSLR